MNAVDTFLYYAAPRILTQVCRDPHSEACGCFDRNWWHYKIRDFPSIILQQGGYFLWLLGQTPARASDREALNRLARAACLFWNRRAMRHGAFEEYYPWEQGYPPLAFSTLALMKLAAQGVVETSEIEGGARVAARQLLHRFECQAANQQVAGLAALAWIRRSLPALVPEDEFLRLKQRTLGLQHAEGWFEEYDGPDLGYLSVTLDCLWDLFDATGDADYVASARRALDFMEPFVALTGAGIGMHNARNTDYIVPYGLARFVQQGDPAGGKAGSVLAALYRDVGQDHHFLHAIDDRYLCHYIGHSVARARLALPNWPEGVALAPRDADFPGSGHVLRAGSIRLILSLKKGGVLTALRGDLCVSDFGWNARIGGTQFVNHWWTSDWSARAERDGWTVSGHLVPHVERESTPVKHALLRAASFTFGRKVIGSLKGRMIFAAKRSPYAFERRVQRLENGLRVIDRISGLPADAVMAEAPRSSKRHVASADSHHAEDFARSRGVTTRSTHRRERGEFHAETTYTFP
jgi:hypothetical protein